MSAESPPSLSQSAPPAVTEALIEHERLCMADLRAAFASDDPAREMAPILKKIFASRSHLEALFREQQEEIERLKATMERRWANQGASQSKTELRAELASLKKEQLTREQAQWLIDLIERTPMKYPLEMNVIYKRLRSISTTPEGG